MQTRKIEVEISEAILSRMTELYILGTVPALVVNTNGTVEHTHLWNDTKARKTYENAVRLLDYIRTKSCKEGEQ